MQAQHNPPINGILDGEADPQVVLNEIITLIENEIPECKQNLRDNHRNLERVAEYCDTNYYRVSKVKIYANSQSIFSHEL